MAGPPPLGLGQGSTWQCDMPVLGVTLHAACTEVPLLLSLSTQSAILLLHLVKSCSFSQL